MKEKQTDMANITASGFCGDALTWELSDEGVLTINGTGEMDSLEPDCDAPWYSCADEIRAVVIGPDVTDLAESSFTGSGKLLKIDVSPDNRFLKSSCGVLFSRNMKRLIVFPAGEKGNYAIPSGVTSMGKFAFCGSSLTTLTFPDSLTEAGRFVFNAADIEAFITTQDNPALRAVDGVLFSRDGSVLLRYPAGKDAAAYTVPAGVTALADHAFGGCSFLKRVTLPPELKTIGRGTFYGCRKLERITLPAGVRKIGILAFSECSGLTEAALSTRLTEIPGMAFENCVSLASITIPKSVKAIREWAFCGCSGLKKICFEGHAPEIREKAFDGVTAEALYPADDDTWMKETGDDHGGCLTRKAV